MTKAPKTKAKKATPKRKPKTGCGGNCTCHQATKTTRPPATSSGIGDIQAIVGRLMTMSDRENAKASVRQIAALFRDREDDERDPMDIFRLAQANRLVSGDPDFSIFHTLAWFILDMPTTADDKKLDQKLAEISAKMRAIEKREGLTDDEYWQLDDAPEDYQALADEWDDRADELRVQLFRLFDEHEMADLYLNDRAEFDRRFDLGRRAVIGEEAIAKAEGLLDQLEQKKAERRERRQSRRGIKS